MPNLDVKIETAFKGVFVQDCQRVFPDLVPTEERIDDLHTLLTYRELPEMDIEKIFLVHRQFAIQHDLYSQEIPAGQGSSTAKWIAPADCKLEGV